MPENQNQDKIKKIIKVVQELPALPVVANRVIALVNDPESGWSDISMVIEHDQSLTANVLKLANSAYYGFSHEIGTIKQAVSLLGFNTISQLVMCVSVLDVFRGKDSVHFDLKQFWKHSIACAIASRIIARNSGYPKPDIVFTAGLLHDIGKVVLDKFFPEDMEAVLRVVEKYNICFFEAERQIMGLDHSVIGDWICRKWKLPLLILVAVKHHHQSPEDRIGLSLSRDTIVDIVRLSDYICRNQGIGSSGDSVIPDLEENLWERLPGQGDNIETTISELKDKIKDSEAFLFLA